MKAVEVILVARGLVQGVNYRWSCKLLAQKHGVTGYAKNLDDGSVEILACGSEDRVNAFADDLRRFQPFPSSVKQLIEVSRWPCAAPPKGFERL